MGNAVYQDLEIDLSDMMSDSVAFSARVTAAAESLKAICKSDTSITAMEKKFRKPNAKVPVESNVLLNAFYDDFDNASLEDMGAFIDAAKKLVSELETAFKDRCIRETAANSETITDKRLAHMQYIKLRDSFNLYVKSLSIFGLNADESIKPLPPLPGNYGNGMTPLKRYAFYYKNDEYLNHSSVIRLAGLDYMPLYEFLDWLEVHPEIDIEVREMTL